MTMVMIMIMTGTALVDDRSHRLPSNEILALLIYFPLMYTAIRLAVQTGGIYISSDGRSVGSRTTNAFSQGMVADGIPHNPHNLVCHFLAEFMTIQVQTA